jgi:hypothetical protein
MTSSGFADLWHCVQLELIPFSTCRPTRKAVSSRMIIPTATNKAKGTITMTKPTTIRITTSSTMISSMAAKSRTMMSSKSTSPFYSISHPNIHCSGATTTTTSKVAMHTMATTTSKAPMATNTMTTSTTISKDMVVSRATARMAAAEDLLKRIPRPSATSL